MTRKSSQMKRRNPNRNHSRSGPRAKGKPKPGVFGMTEKPRQFVDPGRQVRFKGIGKLYRQEKDGSLRRIQ